MTMDVIDLFKTVNIKENNWKRSVVASGDGNMMFNGLNKSAAIGKTGESSLLA